MHLTNLLPLLLALPASLAFSTRSSIPKDAILLSKVRTLTLRANALTSHRRVAAVPQLTCTGPACKHYKIDTLRCTNSGTAYGDEDIEWSCTASLPEEFKLGSTDVACEGYSSRDDPYVLKGSCGVEYRLLYTSIGEEKYGKSGWGGGGNGGTTEWNLGSVLFMVIFVGVLGWIVYSACIAARPEVAGARDARRPGFFGGGGWNPGGGGGGGGPDDPNDPPPPYPGTKPYGSQPQQAWRPGWTGAAAAAGLGYMAGQAGNRGRERDPLFGQQPRRGNNSGGWFGGGNNQGYQAPNRSDSNGSSSSARHESTGFGSTSRR